MYKAISANKRNTVLIMAIFIGVLGAIGWAVGYTQGNSNLFVWVLIVAIVYAIIQYFIASKLAIASTGAVEIQKSDNPRLWNTVENLSITIGIPMPKVYIVDDPAPNAFATGRDPEHAIVAATTGLLDIMNDSELEGVIAHEMGHVQNYDIRVSMIAFGLVSVIGLIANIALNVLSFGDNRRDNNNSNPIVLIGGIIVVLLSPLIATLIQLAISRQREYLADATGVLTTRYPEGLESALTKLMTYGQPMQKQDTATAHLFFSNPLKPGFISGLFSTHPPLEERIARLKASSKEF